MSTREGSVDIGGVPAGGSGGGTGMTGVSAAGECVNSAKRVLRRRGGARSENQGKICYKKFLGLLYRADNLWM